MNRAPFIIFAAYMLVGCTSSTLGYRLQNAEPMLLGENSYNVYKHPALDRAEAHRTNFAFPPPSRALILEQAQTAIRKTTGCETIIGSLKGDHAIVDADLAC